MNIIFLWARTVVACECLFSDLRYICNTCTQVANRYSSKEIKNVQYLQTLGWAQNVDFTSDPSQVLWSAFLNDNRYVSEKLGVFEGACTYIKGAYRPSEESMMNSNTEGFNAPSRKAIYDKIMERSLGTQMSYEEFAVFDLQNKSQTRSAKPTVGPSKPFTRPHFVNRMLDK